MLALETIKAKNEILLLLYMATFLKREKFGFIMHACMQASQPLISRLFSYEERSRKVVERVSNSKKH